LISENAAKVDELNELNRRYQPGIGAYILNLRAELINAMNKIYNLEQQAAKQRQRLEEEKESRFQAEGGKKALHEALLSVVA